MDKSVQREPKRARVNDCIANSTCFISAPVELSLNATNTKTTGRRNINGSYTLKKKTTCCASAASCSVNQGISSTRNAPKQSFHWTVFLTGERP